jgi:peroxiredoxin
VTATVCGWSSFPIVSGLAAESNGTLPLVALTRPDARGMVEVVGHAASGNTQAGGRPPNLIVHFDGDRAGERLGVLVEALRNAGRQDAVTAIVAVVPASELRNTRHTPGVVYAEDHGGAWERAFQLKAARRPLTLIVDPNGKVVWRHEGELDGAALAAALRASLTRGGSVKRTMLRSSLRIGQPPPNFLFEYVPGRQLPLRKLTGRAVTLVFWKAASAPSIDAVREMANGKAARDAGVPDAVVLAINDGDADDLARRTATEHALGATLVVDPNRTISLAYGVNVWPMIVTLDASGLVRDVRYGRG